MLCNSRLQLPGSLQSLQIFELVCELPLHTTPEP
jgi:hypothetical protein